MHDLNDKNAIRINNQQKTIKYSPRSDCRSSCLARTLSRSSADSRSPGWGNASLLIGWRPHRMHYNHPGQFGWLAQCSHADSWGGKAGISVHCQHMWTRDSQPYSTGRLVRVCKHHTDQCPAPCTTTNRKKPQVDMMPSLVSKAQVTAFHYIQMYEVAWEDNCEDHHGEKNHKQTTRIMSGHDCRNRCVFSLRRNTVSDRAVVMSSGRLFQSLRPAVANMTM